MKRHLVFALCIFLVFGVLLLGTGSASSQTANATTSATGTAAATPDFSTVAAQVAAGPHSTIKSADGKLMLLIPKGALPANVPLSKVKITAVKPETVPVTVEGNAPDVSYQFEPDGLQFLTPAILVLMTKPSADDTQPLPVLLSGDQVQVLSPVLYETDPANNNLIVTTSIPHFSKTIYVKQVVGLKVFPDADHTLNDPFTLTAQVSRPSVKDANSPWTLSGLWLVGEESLVYPGIVLNAPPLTQAAASTFTVNQQFTCTALAPKDKLLYGVLVSTELAIVVNGVPTMSPENYELDIKKAFACRHLVSKFVAAFKQSEFATHFTVTASDTDKDPLTYTWSTSNPCGSFTWNANSPEAIWLHPDSELPGACPVEEIHPADITVIVSDGHGANEIITYHGGSASGNCTFQSTDYPIIGDCRFRTHF